MVDENGERRCYSGYGHGYRRFVTLASPLVSCQDKQYEAYGTMMAEEVALVLLRSALKNRNTETAGMGMDEGRGKK